MDVGTYSPGVMADTELLGWWLHLGETGDLERCFGRQACALSEFFRGLAATTLYFARDEKGWAATIWADRLLSGAAVGLWVREDARQSTEVYRFITNTFEHLLTLYPVLIFATRSAPLLRQAAAIGFIPMGEVPYLFDGDACSIGYATPFTYEGAQQSRPALNGKDG